MSGAVNGDRGAADSSGRKIGNILPRRRKMIDRWCEITILDGSIN
jgi:hypothetical protein